IRFHWLGFIASSPLLPSPSPFTRLRCFASIRLHLFTSIGSFSSRSPFTQLNSSASLRLHSSAYILRPSSFLHLFSICSPSVLLRSPPFTSVHLCSPPFTSSHPTVLERTGSRWFELADGGFVPLPERDHQRGGREPGV